MFLYHFFFKRKYYGGVRYQYETIQPNHIKQIAMYRYSRQDYNWSENAWQINIIGVVAWGAASRGCWPRQNWAAEVLKVPWDWEGGGSLFWSGNAQCVQHAQPLGGWMGCLWRAGSWSGLPLMGWSTLLLSAPFSALARLATLFLHYDWCHHHVCQVSAALCGPLSTLLPPLSNLPTVTFFKDLSCFSLLV